MKNQFMRVEEVAQELEVSRSYAYRLIRQLNAELHEKGYMNHRRASEPAVFSGTTVRYIKSEGV